MVEIYVPDAPSGPTGGAYALCIHCSRYSPVQRILVCQKFLAVLSIQAVLLPILSMSRETYASPNPVPLEIWAPI